MKGKSFQNIYNQLFARCQVLREQESAEWCLVAVDIEHFRLFNEVYGRTCGDQLLADYWEIIDGMGEEVLSAYLGSDHYILFMKYNMRVIDELLNALAEAVRRLSDSLGFQPALGVCKISPEETLGLEMYDNAVLAMRAAKNDRKNRIKVYDPLVHSDSKKETELLVALQKAVASGEVTFYVQPQCLIDNHNIVGAEALVRWIRPDGSMISPGIFIPILEKQGFIADFDKMVWEMVCKWLASLLDRGMKPLPISINVSQIDILTMDVADYLAELCDQYRIPHKLLKIEITESSFAEEYNLVKKLMNELKQHGFSTIMDDFGSGYSSLNMLERISVDVIKLDMAFLRQGGTHSRRSVTIIESVINMAKMMGLPIIVEGVETQEQVDFLNSTGCRYAQGFYYYRPMATSDFEQLLQTDLADYGGLNNKRNEQVHVREFLDANTFTDTMLNNVLGAVAFYSLDHQDLTITRFNEQFYKVIGDPSMESRQVAIQNYVVQEDWPNLYRALDDAYEHLTEGGQCEIRFYKSDGGVFWFKMHFFYLKNERSKRIYYGQVEDVTESREQSLMFLEMLRENADVSMMMNLDHKTIQYVTQGNTLSQLGLPKVDLEESNRRTAQMRFDDDAERQRFLEFFNVDRLRNSHRKAKYNESITLNFKLTDKAEPIVFSTYYIRWNKDQDLVVYVFAKRKQG